MALMATTPLFTLLSTTTATKNGISSSTNEQTFRWKPQNSKRLSSVVTRVASSIPPVNVEYLESEFGGRGVSFGALGDGCVVNMSLVNGSAAIVMLPEGLITSYKAAMWHRGTDELIHTLVSEDDADVRGGVSLQLDFRVGDAVSWSPSNWVVHKITGSSRTSIQVQ